MKAREGDLIKTRDGVVFDVKGTIHPPDKIIAFPRFIPLPEGNRKLKGTTYGKVYSLSDRFRYLQENAPDLVIYDSVFDETLCEVPIALIIEHYRPEEKLWELRSAKDLTLLEYKGLQLASALKAEADIPWSSIGVSGSIMAELTNEKSDIDPLVYGTENCRKAYAALQRLLGEPESGFKPYSEQELHDLFDFRVKDTKMSFQDFQAVERRKAFQGKYIGTDYFIRFVKEYSEANVQYGDIWYRNSGYVKIQARVVEASEALFTPCTYVLDDVKVLEGPELSPIKEVVSYRGRFCMQATVGEQVELQGKIEYVTNQKTCGKHYRLILGNKPDDYMVLCH